MARRIRTLLAITAVILSAGSAAVPCPCACHADCRCCEESSACECCSHDCEQCDCGNSGECECCLTPVFLPAERRGNATVEVNSITNVPTFGEQSISSSEPAILELPRYSFPRLHVVLSVWRN